MRTFRLAVPALAACLALGACGGADTGGGTPTPTGASPVTDSPIPEPTTPGAGPPTTPGDPADKTAPVVPPSPTKRPGGPSKPPPGGATTLTGQVQSGVEPGCLLLDGYLLLGGPRDVLASGASVVVTGKIQPDVLTTCQEGIPFMVETARRG